MFDCRHRQGFGEGKQKTERKVLIPRQDLTRIISEGNQRGYASGTGPEIDEEGMKNFRHQITIGNRLYCYHDRYSGYFKAPGTTIVSIRDLNYLAEFGRIEKGTPVWFMNYGSEENDGIQPIDVKKEDIAPEVFAFLREMLKIPAGELPVRGPKKEFKDGYSYYFDWEGDIDEFKAQENIASDKLGYGVFTQNISGGFFKHKNLEIELF